MTINDRIQELIADEAFAKGIFEAGTPDELMKVFAEYRIDLEDMTKEAAFESIQKAKSDELLENELDDVSGGGIFTTMLFYTAPYVPGGAIVVGAVAVGALAYYAYRRYKKK